MEFFRREQKKEFVSKKIKCTPVGVIAAGGSSMCIFWRDFSFFCCWILSFNSPSIGKLFASCGRSSRTLYGFCYYNHLPTIRTTEYTALTTYRYNGCADLFYSFFYAIFSWISVFFPSVNNIVWFVNERQLMQDEHTHAYYLSIGRSLAVGVSGFTHSYLVLFFCFGPLVLFRIVALLCFAYEIHITIIYTLLLFRCFYSLLVCDGLNNNNNNNNEQMNKRWIE